MSKVKIEEIVEDKSSSLEQSKPSDIQNIEILEKKEVNNKNMEEKTTNILPNVQQDENIKSKNSVNAIIELNEKWKNTINLYNEINKEFTELNKKILSIHEYRHDKLKDAYDTLLLLTELIINNKDNQIKILSN